MMLLCLLFSLLYESSFLACSGLLLLSLLPSGRGQGRLLPTWVFRKNIPDLSSITHLLTHISHFDALLLSPY